MSKSTITFKATDKGYEVRQGRKLVFRSQVRKEAKAVLRQAREADRAAQAHLKNKD